MASCKPSHHPLSHRPAHCVACGEIVTWRQVDRACSAPHRLAALELEHATAQALGELELHVLLRGQGQAEQVAP